MRQRFSSWRVAKILGLTAAVLTWSAALFARLVGFPVAEASAPAPQDGPEDDGTAVSSTTATFDAPLPDLPEGGLVIIRAARTAEPQPIVRRVVVHQQGAAPAPASQAPQKRTQSSGS